MHEYYLRYSSLKKKGKLFEEKGKHDKVRLYIESFLVFSTTTMRCAEYTRIFMEVYQGVAKV